MLNRVDSKDATYDIEVYYTDPIQINTTAPDPADFFATPNVFNVSAIFLIL